jgi:inner membrane protein
MDPLAHTLFGAALAEAGLKRVSPRATAALLIGANLPDLDIVAQFWGTDAALYARRGWTHGMLAMAVLPLLLAGALLLWHRWRAKPGDDATALRPRALLAVACVAVWSHPLLDWLNTYGVRLLMPFDGRWFHGDAAFIVDPWLWLLLAAGVVLARSARWPAQLAWAALAGIATWLVLSRPLPPGVVPAWFIGVAVVLLLRWRLPAAQAGRVAGFGIAAAVAYAGLLFGLARAAETRAAERFPTPQAVQANPAPGHPFMHRIVLAYPERYRVIDYGGSVLELPRTPPDATVRRALADPSIRGFANWTRFPWWEVEAQPDGWRVRFHDLRYSRPGERCAGIGCAEVLLAR